MPRAAIDRTSRWSSRPASAVPSSIDGRLVDGDSGNAGHIGHLNVVPDGRSCSCGAFGCLEAEASGWAIEEMTGRPAEAGRRGDATSAPPTWWVAPSARWRRCSTSITVTSPDRWRLGFGDEFFETANKSARANGHDCTTRGTLRCAARVSAATDRLLGRRAAWRGADDS